MWLAGNKLSWYPVLLYLIIQFCAIKCRFIDDYLYQKLLILVQICWKYLRISQGSGFFRHSVGPQPHTAEMHFMKAHGPHARRNIVKQKKLVHGWLSNLSLNVVDQVL